MLPRLLRRSVHTAPRYASVAAAAQRAAPPPPPPASAAKAPATSSNTGSVFHSSPPLPLAVSASGVTYTLADGTRVLDGVSGGAAVSCLGASNPDIVQVMAEQAAQMPYAYHGAVHHARSEALADFLVSRSAGAFVAGAFFNSGSEANEAILKLVRQYWLERGEPARKYVIAREYAYHGNTLGALGVGYTPARRNLYSPYFTDVYQHVSMPSPRVRRDGESDEAFSARMADELEAKIQALGPENCAAFLVEPVGGSGPGIIPPPRGYFPAMAAVARKYGLLLAMDEVMCGSGRSGDLFAHTSVAEGVQPDVISMAKGLGAAYVTISGVMIGPRIADVIRGTGPWKNSHTYQNHPVNCAVALAVMKKVEALLPNVRERGLQIVAELKDAFKDDPAVYDVRGQGLFIGVEFEVPKGLKTRFGPRVKEVAMQNGLMALGITGSTDGDAGDALILAPAYTVTPEEASEMVRIVKKSVDDVKAELL